jgi:hypothetical protein
MPIENQVYRNITNQGALNHLLDNLGPQQKAVAVLVGDRQWGIRVVDAPNAVVRLIHSLTGQTRREQRRLEDFRSQLPAAPSAPTDSTPAVDPLASTEMTASAAPEPGMVRLERARQALQDNGLTPESFVDLVTKWMSMGKDFSPHQLSQVYQLALFDGGVPFKVFFDHPQWCQLLHISPDGVVTPKASEDYAAASGRARFGLQVKRGEQRNDEALDAGRRYTDLSQAEQLAQNAAIHATGDGVKDEPLPVLYERFGAESFSLLFTYLRLAHLNHLTVEQAAVPAQLWQGTSTHRLCDHWAEEGDATNRGTARLTGATIKLGRLMDALICVEQGEPLQEAQAQEIFQYIQPARL